MGNIAVITGDIVDSRKVADREALTKKLKSLFASIDKLVLGQNESFEIFRGDSFQAIVKEPDKALLAGILLRAGLKMGEPGKASRLSIDGQTDARIAIGIGAISYKAAKVVESDGEAFHRSGKTLEILSESNSRLAINTPWDRVNEEFAVSTLLADALIKKWTPAAAEASYYYLLYNSTQTELSERFKISQPAVHKRLVQADVYEIKTLIERYKKIVLQNS